MGQELQFTTAKPGIGKVLFVVFLMLSTPLAALLIWHTMYNLEGSVTALFREIIEMGPLHTLQVAWLNHFWGSAFAWKLLALFMAAQVLMMAVLPGKAYQGPITPMGNVPEYKDNGLLSYSISIALFVGLELGWPGEGSLSLSIYQHFGEILAALNVFALAFCLLLYFKGRFAPSSTDASTSGNFLFDFYWGTELYPRILGIDVKMFTNCRVGMTGWALSAMAFAFAQKELLGSFDPGVVVTAALLVMYLMKFFIWEPGYMRSTDIITDRAGYYICWGCLVWVPAVYSSPAFFMVGHAGIMPMWVAVLVFVAGTVAIWMNYWADHQRMAFRAAGGNVKIWGKQATFIKAQYTTGKGELKENLLLTSGFWGMARHFHYLPELAAAFLWSCTAGFGWFMPYFYFLFLCLLLVHRTYRDDEKCLAKYGPAWREYQKQVPARLIPGVY